LSSGGPAAESVRRDFRDILARRGHAVDNARAAVARLEQAFADGALRRTPELDSALADLRVALAQADGDKLGGRGAEAARLIGRRLERLLDDA
jgi:hypothetical protein